MVSIGKLFDNFHIIYTIISLLLTILILMFSNKYIKRSKYKDKVLKFWGIITVFLHISPLWYDFLNNKIPIASDNMLFPIYFCNLAMYLLLITAFIEDKTTKRFNNIATITAYSGILGALISLFYPDYYIDNQFNYGVLKSMLSHSTMLIGALYLFTGKYIKVKKINTIIFIKGLLGFGLVGIVVILTYKVFGLTPPNAMYILKPAINTGNKISNILLSGYMIAIYLVIVVYLFNSIYIKFEKVRINKKGLSSK